MLKAGGNTGQRQGQETEAKPVFPPLRPMAAEAVEEEISCVSGEGLAFAEASFDLSEFATVRLSGCKFKNCSFYRTSLVKVLIENCSFAGCRFEGGYWQNVFAEESKFTGCDFNETVFKDTVFRRCLLQYANLNWERAATGDFGRNPADGFRIERMQGAGLTAASGGFNRDELL